MSTEVAFVFYKNVSNLLLLVFVSQGVLVVEEACGLRGCNESYLVQSSITINLLTLLSVHRSDELTNLIVT